MIAFKILVKISFKRALEGIIYSIITSSEQNNAFIVSGVPIDRANVSDFIFVLKQSVEFNGNCVVGWTGLITTFNFDSINCQIESGWLVNLGLANFPNQSFSER